MSVELNSMSSAKTRAPAWITASVAPLFRNLYFALEITLRGKVMTQASYVP